MSDNGGAYGGHLAQQRQHYRLAYDQLPFIRPIILPLFMQQGWEINGGASGINCAISTMYKTVYNGGICIRYERRRGKGWHAASLRIIVILRNYVE
jgi:hypothetical protein